MVKRAGKNDLEIVVRLMALMWNNRSTEELTDDFSKIISNGHSQFF